MKPKAAKHPPNESGVRKREGTRFRCMTNARAPAALVRRSTPAPSRSATVVTAAHEAAVAAATHEAVFA
jgi:hypothetical protein